MLIFFDIITALEALVSGPIEWPLNERPRRHPLSRPLGDWPSLRHVTSAEASKGQIVLDQLKIEPLKEAGRWLYFGCGGRPLCAACQQEKMNQKRGLWRP